MTKRQNNNFIDAKSDWKERGIKQWEYNDECRRFLRWAEYKVPEYHTKLCNDEVPFPKHIHEKVYGKRKKRKDADTDIIKSDSDIF